MALSLSRRPTTSGTPTGQQLSYDAEGRLTSWQDQPSAPTKTANYLYDGAGHRVAMQTTVSGATTLTAYIGGIEDVQTTGSTTQTTTYYAVGGMRIAAAVNGTFSYFGYDALGSQVMVLNASGSVVGEQLFGPYGNQRYSTGTLPTSIGFTGQRGDSVSGLDYYVARYYDPVAGVFLSVDSVQGNRQGMNPYGYVGGNPETRTDPTGQRIVDMNGDYGYVTSDGNHGVNISTFVKDWQTVYHMNARHLIDYVHGSPVDHNVPHTDANSDLTTWLTTWWNKLVAAYHETANDPYAQLALGFSDGMGDGNGLNEESPTLTSAELGALREQYVIDNLSSLIPDAGGNLQTQVKFSVPGATAKADFVTDNAIGEVGGIGKTSDLSDFGKQLSVYRKSAQPGQKVYFLYDNSSGALPSELQRIADQQGVIIIQFTLPPRVIYN